MSPQGGRQVSGRGGGSASGPAATRRLGLLIFGVTFLVLFIVVAIAEGLGDPSIPSGDILVVEEAGDAGKVSQEDFDHALVLSAAQAGEKKVPKPGDPKYEEVRDAAINSLLEAAWFEGQGAEMGVEVSDAEVARELAKIKKESFQSPAEFQKFLKESKFTPEDVNQRVKLQILSTEIQEKFKEGLAGPTQDEIEDYYEAAKTTQFTQEPSRDVRVIRNEDQAKAEQALAQLESGNTAKDWSKAAKEFSEDAATKAKGGLQQNVTEGTLEEPLNSEVFGAAEGQLKGPVKTQQGFYIFEVQNSTPESVQDLKSVEGQIESQLSQRSEQEIFGVFVSDFNTRWRSRTFCADGYVIEQCANFKSSGRPASAPPACYEEDPDGGRPEACPAPVFQLVPALPGTVTPLEPKGQALAQRPVPVDGEEGAGAEEGAGLPGAGAVPPPAEAPPSE